MDRITHNHFHPSPPFLICHPCSHDVPPMHRHVYPPCACPPCTVTPCACPPCTVTFSHRVRAPHAPSHHVRAPHAPSHFPTMCVPPMHRHTTRVLPSTVTLYARIVEHVKYLVEEASTAGGDVVGVTQSLRRSHEKTHRRSIYLLSIKYRKYDVCVCDEACAM